MRKNGSPSSSAVEARITPRSASNSSSYRSAPEPRSWSMRLERPRSSWAARGFAWAANTVRPARCRVAKQVNDERAECGRRIQQGGQLTADSASLARITFVADRAVVLIPGPPPVSEAHRIVAVLPAALALDARTVTATPDADDLRTLNRRLARTYREELPSPPLRGGAECPRQALLVAPDAVADMHSPKQRLRVADAFQ